MKRIVLLLLLVVVGIAAWLTFSTSPSNSRHADGQITSQATDDAPGAPASDATQRAVEQTSQAEAPGSSNEPQVSSSKPKGPVPRHPRPAPAGAALEMLARLSTPASQGDATAAFDLWELLEECARVTAALKATTPNVTTLVRDCDQVPEQEIGDRLKWLETAADRGNLEARLAYPGFAGMRYSDPREIAKDVQAFSNYQAKSLRYLNAAAESGSADAMIALAMAYREGTLGAVDPMREYAYLYAAAQTGLVQSAASATAHAESGLTAVQIQEGQLLAGQLLARCCR